MNYICVFDLETDSVKPETCSPVEVACTMINPYNLEIMSGSEFSSGMRPEGIDDLGYANDPEIKKTIDFHCKNRKITKKELLEEWASYPPAKLVWEQYADHVNRYNKGGTEFTAPYAGGINIINFDLVIANRMNEKYGIKKLYGHEIFDLRHILLCWLWWDSGLKSRKFDNIRKYMGMESEGSHGALFDARQEAEVLQKFLTLHKSLFPKIRFKDCFKEEN